MSRIRKTTETTPYAGHTVNTHSDSTVNAYSCNYVNKALNNIIGNVCLKSLAGITSALITSSNGYGNVWVYGTNFISKIQFLGTNQTPSVWDAVGTHPFSVSINGNTITLSDLGSWDHYIFIGSSIITDITTPSNRSVENRGDIEEKKDIVIEDGGEEKPIDNGNQR